MMALIAVWRNRRDQARSKVEEALHESNRLLRFAQECANSGIWEWDLKTQTLTWSDQCYKLHGLSPDSEMSFERWLSLVHEDDRANIEETIAARIEDGDELRIEFRCLHPERGIIWITGIGRTILGIDGRPQRMGGIALDITQQKLGLEDRAWLSAIVDSTSDAIISESMDGIITSWNEAAKAMYGYDREEVMGKSVTILSPEELFDETIRLVQAVRRGEKIHNFETMRRRKDGSVLWASLSISPVYDACGNIIGISKIARDVTERKKAEQKYQQELIERRKTEQALRQAKDIADAANAAKSAFLANMSHEIRTPLGAILGFSELLVMREQDPADQEECVDVIKRNGQLLLNLINDILDLSKVEAGRLSIEKAPTLLPRLLEEIRVSLNLQAVSKGIQLSFIQKSPIPTLIETDSVRFKQILNNIVGNAIKFTERGSVTVEMQMVSKDEGKQLLYIEVRDTGPGISPEYASKLFEPFNQADPTYTRKHGGTGLGLALSRKLATLLGGDVLLTESEPGVGSVFAIYIDPGSITQRHTQAESSHVNQPARLSRPKQSLEGLKVLIVDDAEDNRRLIARMLRMVGAEVETAADGSQALHLAFEKELHVIIMDVQMPIMDGFAATTELRRRGFKKPIVALTAHAMKEERDRCMAGGFNSHMSKPVDWHELVSQLSHYKLKSNQQWLDQPKS